MNIKRGVYFLANDNIIELTIAFLNSFRKFNPDISMCFIPYNSNYQKVAELSNKYHFSIFDDKKFLNECDRISTEFFRNTKGTFRKLALWEGPFDEFIYIDIDTIVLTNVEFSFNYLSDYDFITSVSSLPYIRKFVWKNSIYSVKVLMKDQINYATNTGYIISHKKALPFNLIKEKLPSALKIKAHMELYCQEQPFLNYLFVTSGKYTSLLSLSIKNGNQKIPLECWAGRVFGIVFKGKIFFPCDISIFSKGKITFPYNSNIILLIHWAGKYQLKKIEKWLYRKVYNIFSIKNELPKISFFMPYKRLWKYYRYMGE